MDSLRAPHDMFDPTEKEDVNRCLPKVLYVISVSDGTNGRIE